MSAERSWLLSHLGWKIYLKKYPFVFIFSFITAFCWVLKADTPWAFTNPSTPLANLGHFQPWAYCCLFGIPLFILIHLLLNSPRLKNFKFHTTVILLGWAVLLGLYFDLSENNLFWSDFFQPFLIVTIAAFLWPVFGWNLTPAETSAYFWNVLKGLMKSFAAFFLASGLLIWFLSVVNGLMSGSLSYLFHSRGPGVGDVIGLSNQILSPLVFTWYLLGGLLKTLDRPEAPAEPVVPLRAAITTAVLVLLAIGFPLEGFKVFQQWQRHQSIFFLDEKIILFLLAFLSIGLARAQKGNGFEKWQGIYPKIISGLSVLLILLTGFYHPSYGWGSAWTKDVYYSLIYVIWFMGTFIYFFLSRKANWVKPVLVLELILIVTLAGPLSPKYLSLKSRESGLKKNLTQLGLLKDGLLVRGNPENKSGQLTAVPWELKGLSHEDGLNWLKSAFPPELRDLDWSQPNGDIYLPRLIEWLGLPAAQARNNMNRFQQFSAQNERNEPKRFGPYELINFNFGQGNSLPPEVPDYFLLFPHPWQSLNVIYQGKRVGVIPLSQFVERLLKYSNNTAVMRHIPPEDMTLEYKNKSVEIEMSFSALTTMVTDGKQVIQGGYGSMLVRRLAK